MPRSWRVPALLWLGLTAACSVYTTDLLEETTGIISGGTGNATAGQTSTLAGTAATTGGKNSGEMPSTGGEGGDGAGMGEGGESGAGGVANGGSPTDGAGAPPTGGAGGSTSGGTGGSVGNGGGPTGTAGVANGPSLVDGFEDDDLILEDGDGRSGVWYLVGDGTAAGKLTPNPLACSANSGAPAALGAYAMHITATGFTGAGSILGADFRDKKVAYDAGRFTGIRFWAKVAAGKNTKVRVQIADATTDKAGGKCVPLSTVAAEKCDDHFGSTATLTTTWAQYSIPFAQMMQSNWGKQGVALDKGEVYGVQFSFKAVPDVDLWLDEVELF